MIPDVQLQLQAVIKSLQDNVAPAVDGDNALAQQQLQLSLATLGIISEQLPMVHKLLRRDIELHVELAQQLLNDKAADDQHLTAALQQAQSALADSTLGFVQLQEQARALRAVLGHTITDVQSTNHSPELDQQVLALASHTLLLGRSWNKARGFEPDPKQVPELASLL